MINKEVCCGLVLCANCVLFECDITKIQFFYHDVGIIIINKRGKLEILT